MEKRSIMNMNPMILVMGLLVFIASDILPAQNQKRKTPQNVERFTLAVFPTATVKGDSIRLIAYLEIPYPSLQFLKKGKEYWAGYEASLDLKDMKENPYGRKIWKDSLVVDNYILTQSRNKSVTLWTDLMVPVDKYVLHGEVVDLDTRNVGQQSLDIDLKKYSGEVILYPIIHLNQKKGDWGFNQDEIPSFTNKVADEETDIVLYISGKVLKGDYKITVDIHTAEEKKQWMDTTMTAMVQGGIIHRIPIPSVEFEGLTIDCNIALSQGNTVQTQELTISTLRPGITGRVTDIREALNQMRYILSSKERSRLKSAKQKDWETLFLEFWAVRDPSPGTIHNELMDQYYLRVQYANEHFATWQAGWESDLGMIYIMFGPPDDIERSTMSSQRRSYQVWYYYRINREFVFLDDNGFGEYRLKTPFYPSRYY